MTQFPLPLNAPTLVPALDGERLKSQLGKVFRLMSDGRWRTLAQIREQIGCGSEAGISARLRDLRKAGHVVLRQRVRATGLWVYKLVPRSGMECS